MPKITNIKSDFPIFNTYPKLVYLDNSATSQKPNQVIEAIKNYYTTKNANIHRGIYRLAELATEAYENTRTEIQKFINAKENYEIIFTNNTNHSINIVSHGWAKKFLHRNDIILLSEMEHHANIVPWIKLREEIGIKLIFLPINKNYRLDYQEIIEKNKEKIKLVCLTHTSNVLGTINPLEEIIPFIRKNLNAKILIDAAQSAPHLPIDVQALDIDFLAFSSHKMLGPTGVGILWAKESLLENMDPCLLGSHMIKTVTKNEVTWGELPDKFETGTPNIEGVIGLNSAISYLNKIGFKNIITQEKKITKYGLEQLNQVPYLKLYGPNTVKNRLGIFSFTINKAHPHDVSQILDKHNICVRSGHHCAQITMKALNLTATTRASLYIYNTLEDIDKLILGLSNVKKILKI